MEILYLDNKIIVCVKPGGVLSTDESGGMPGLLREALGDPAAAIYTVHRLDAAVGGLMVYARTRHAAGDLGRAIMNGGFQKTYLAVLRGIPGEKEAVLRNWLLRDTRRGVTKAVPGPEPGAKEAELAYRILDEREGLSLTEIRLRTGRTHQIRCQFAARGLPLWGDRKYGSREEGPIALWSHRLAFTHPATGEALDFRLAPPRDDPWTLFEEALWKQN